MKEREKDEMDMDDLSKELVNEVNAIEKEDEQKEMVESNWVLIGLLYYIILI